MISDRPLERVVLLVDLALLLVSLLAAHGLRATLAAVLPGLKPVVPAEMYAHLLLVFVPTWALCAERVGLHLVTTVTGPPLGLLRALVWAQAWGALAIALILVLAQVELNRSLIAAFLVVSTLILLAGKYAERAWLESHHGRALVLLLGRERGGRPGELERDRGRRVEVLGEWTPEALHERLRRGGVDEVVVGPVVPRPAVRPLLEVCDEVAVPVYVAVERLDLGLRPPRAEVIGRTLYLAYHRLEPDRPALFVKALLDRSVGAAAALLALPLALGIAVLVKLTSPGPVLFVQRRGGRFGRPFSMLKFRTMRVGAEAEREGLLAANEMDGPVFKIRDDPRVTALGRLLRRASLDELPQLWNVAAGHMSLVGPRPLPLVETESLTGSHRRRLGMRPGLTCLWQVGGRSQLGFREWMALDLEYVDNWSLGLDLAILLRTIPALLSGRGAR
jgi:exopolysaccharide biosynthesis polyprenyl glycosylphosphotransferase